MSQWLPDGINGDPDEWHRRCQRRMDLMRAANLGQDNTILEVICWVSGGITACLLVLAVVAGACS